jgi:hypothetical protein
MGEGKIRRSSGHGSRKTQDFWRWRASSRSDGTTGWPPPARNGILRGRLRVGPPDSPRESRHVRADRTDAGSAAVRPGRRLGDARDAARLGGSLAPGRAARRQPQPDRLASRPRSAAPTAGAREGDVSARRPDRHGAPSLDSDGGTVVLTARSSCPVFRFAATVDRGRRQCDSCKTLRGWVLSCDRK